MTKPAKGHRFDDEEFARIMKRAVELEGRPEVAGVPELLPSLRSDGLTLGQVLQVAAEVGIDPAHVVRAVDSLGVERWSGLARVFGGPIRVRGRRTLLRMLTPEEMGGLLEVVRETLGIDGEAHEVLGGVEWKGKKGQDPVSVRFVPEESGTIIHLNAERGLTAFLSHYLPILASLGIAGITIGAMEPLSGSAMTGVILGCATVGYGVARSIWATETRRWRRLLDTVGERMEMLAKEE